MADKKLTKRQIRNRVDDEVIGFMQHVREFLATKAGNENGEIPPEWELSVTLLEAYYRQFAELNLVIGELDSLLVDSRYGPQPTPLLAVRDKASVRLEALMKEMGLSMKSGLKLGVTDAKKEETPLDKFLKNKGKKETR